MSNTRYVGLEKEDNYGVTEASPSDRYEDALCNIQPNPNWIIPEPVGMRAYQKRATGLTRNQGNIGDFEVTPNGIIGDLLMGVLGDVDTANPTSGVYTHTFSPADTLPSYTTRIGVELAERYLVGCLIEQLTIKFSAGQFVKANALIYSGFGETKTTINTAPTFDTQQPLTQLDSLVSFTVGGEDSKAILSDLEITIKNNIPFSRGDLSGDEFSTKRYGQRTVTGRLTAYFDDTNIYDDFIAGTAFDLAAYVQGSLISGAYRHKLELDLYECQYLRDAAPNVTNQSSPLVINALFQAFKDPDEELDVKAILQNSVAAY